MGSNLEKFFFQMGTRVKHVEVRPQPVGWRRVNSRGEDLPVVLDIKRDSRGSFFEVRTLSGTRQELLVLNAEPRKRHLLLLSRQFDPAGRLVAKQKFLCGYDERHWFVAAIPEDEPVSTVAGAQTPTTRLSASNAGIAFHEHRKPLDGDALSCVFGLTARSDSLRERGGEGRWQN
jgi:dTDP-4-dehydrorhamnose 3,5-epimerase-like enzyme